MLCLFEEVVEYLVVVFYSTDLVNISSRSNLLKVVKDRNTYWFRVVDVGPVMVVRV